VVRLTQAKHSHRRPQRVESRESAVAIDLSIDLDHITRVHEVDRVVEQRLAQILRMQIDSDSVSLSLRAERV
jgi:hypothetical protein